MRSRSIEHIDCQFDRRAPRFRSPHGRPPRSETTILAGALIVGVFPSACSPSSVDELPETAGSAFVDQKSLPGDTSGAVGDSSTLPGSGKEGYECPDVGTYPYIDYVGPGEELYDAVEAAPAGAVLCIEGYHRITQSLRPKSGQRWIGIGPLARISGAAQLKEWTQEADVWVYQGEWASIQPTMDENGEYSYGVSACYEVSTYHDDVFYRPTGGALKRMMRVMSLDQLRGLAPLPPGQMETPAEYGRFFFDYEHDRIYINQNPLVATVELAIVDTVIKGADYGSEVVSGVVLRNLLIEQALTHVIDAYNSPSWRIEDCTIRYAHNNGVRMASGAETNRFVIDSTLISNNGQFGVTGTSWTTIMDSELSWNNIANYRKYAPSDGYPFNCEGYWMAGAAKFFNVAGTPTTPGLIVKNLNSHHNIGDGFWTDVNNQHVMINGGQFHHNERNGYFHEISCDITIKNAEMSNNGQAIKNIDMVGAGINVFDSNNGLFRDNLVFGNSEGGILLRWGAHAGVLDSCLGGDSDSDVSSALKNNLVTLNDIYMCKGETGSRGDTLANRSNAFKANRYYVPDNGAYWRDLATLNSWSAWQAAGQDTMGTRTLHCTYP